ncbi:14396_t:CDS:2, partial [Funneliformis geosporum]
AISTKASPFNSSLAKLSSKTFLNSVNCSLVRERKTKQANSKVGKRDSRVGRIVQKKLEYDPNGKMEFPEFKIKNITQNCTKGGENYLYFFELEEVISVDDNEISQVGVKANTNILNSPIEEEFLIKGGYVKITNVKKTPYVQDYRIIENNPTKTLLIERTCEINVDLRGVERICFHIRNGFDFHTDLIRPLFICPADSYSVGRGAINNEGLETITDTI